MRSETELEEAGKSNRGVIEWFWQRECGTWRTHTTNGMRIDQRMTKSVEQPPGLGGFPQGTPNPNLFYKTVSDGSKYASNNSQEQWQRWQTLPRRWRRQHIHTRFHTNLNKMDRAQCIQPTLLGFLFMYIYRIQKVARQLPKTLTLKLVTHKRSINKIILHFNRHACSE